MFIQPAQKLALMGLLMRSGNKYKQIITRGFTLVELLVVLAILALLLTLAVPRYFKSVHLAKEATLREDLNRLRESIDKFYADTGQYPQNLTDLVEQKYIRAVPIDPITEKNNTWILVSPELPLEGIYDIHSGAETLAKDGTYFANW